MPGGCHAAELLASSPIPANAYYPEFDITNLVQQWVRGEVENFGVVLKNDTPVGTGIKASEYSEYGRPFMEITYAPAASALFADGFESGDSSMWSLAVTRRVEASRIDGPTVWPSSVGGFQRGHGWRVERRGSSSAPIR